MRCSRIEDLPVPDLPTIPTPRTRSASCSTTSAPDSTSLPSSAAAGVRLTGGWVIRVIGFDSGGLFPYDQSGPLVSRRHAPREQLSRSLLSPCRVPCGMPPEPPSAGLHTTHETRRPTRVVQHTSPSKTTRDLIQ